MVQHNPEDFLALNNYFDHIYVLTIEGAENRQKAIAAPLEGLDWSFFYGVHKKNLNLDALISSGEYDEEKHLATKRTTRSMSLAEVACAMSHRAIYQDVLDNNYQRVLILEDDVLPLYENLNNFQYAVDELPDDWDLLMLGYHSEKPQTLKYKIQTKIYLLYHYLHLFNWHNVSVELIKSLCMVKYKTQLYTLGKVLGAHAYAISNACAKKYIAYQTPIIIQSDRVFNYHDPGSKNKTFAVKKKLFTFSELAKSSYIKG